MIKYTDGPWARSGSGVDVYAVNLPHPQDAASRVCVASTFRADDGLSYAQMEANARLIAAAPALVNALIDANEKTKLSPEHGGRWGDLIAEAIGA